MRSTFIAGFPGETEAEFEHLLEFMREARHRPRRLLRLLAGRGRHRQRAARRMLPAELREERRARFMAVAEAVSADKLQRRVGATMQVLVDRAPALGRKGGVGRSYADAPEIDGTVQLLPPEKASKTLKVGEFARARIVARAGPRPGRRSRSELPARCRTTQDKPPISTALIHHPYEPPAGFGAPQPAVHKASTVIFAERRGDARARLEAARPATPTACTARRPPSRSRSASPRSKAALQTLLVPSGLAAIALVDMALLKQRRRGADARQRLRPEQGAGAPRAGALGHRAPLLRPDGAGVAARPRCHAGDAAGVDRGAGLGDDGVSRPAARWCAAARAHGGASSRSTTPGAPAWRSIRSTSATALGVDISMQALTKYPSGGGDVLMGAVTTRDEALHQQLKLTHMRMGWGVGANDAEVVLRSLPSLAAALRRAGPQRAACWRVVDAAAARSTHVLHPALPGSPGHEHWAALCTARGGPVLGRASTRATASRRSMPSSTR